MMGFVFHKLDITENIFISIKTTEKYTLKQSLQTTAVRRIRPVKHFHPVANRLC